MVGDLNGDDLAFSINADGRSAGKFPTSIFHSPGRRNFSANQID